jgi:hypothetical protein
MFDLIFGPSYEAIAHKSRRNIRGWEKWPLYLMYHRFLYPIAVQCQEIDPESYFSPNTLRSHIAMAMVGANSSEGERKILWDLQPYDLYCNMNQAHVITLKVIETDSYRLLQENENEVRLSNTTFILPEDANWLWSVLPRIPPRPKNSETWYYLLTNTIRSSNELFLFFCGSLLWQEGCSNVERGVSQFVVPFEDQNLSWVSKYKPFVGHNTSFSFFFNNKQELMACMIKLNDMLGLKYLQKYAEALMDDTACDAPQKYFTGVDIRSHEALEKYLGSIGVPKNKLKRFARRWKSILSPYSPQYIHKINYGVNINDWSDTPMEEIEPNVDVLDSIQFNLVSLFQNEKSKPIPSATATRILEKGELCSELFAHFIRMRCLGALIDYERQGMDTPPNILKSFTEIVSGNHAVFPENTRRGWTDFLNHTPETIEELENTSTNNETTDPEPTHVQGSPRTRNDGHISRSITHGSTDAMSDVSDGPNSSPKHTSVTPLPTVGATASLKKNMSPPSITAKKYRTPQRQPDSLSDGPNSSPEDPPANSDDDSHDLQIEEKSKFPAKVSATMPLSLAAAPSGPNTSHPSVISPLFAAVSPLANTSHLSPPKKNPKLERRPPSVTTDWPEVIVDLIDLVSGDESSTAHASPNVTPRKGSGRATSTTNLKLPPGTGTNVGSLLHSHSTCAVAHSPERRGNSNRVGRIGWTLEEDLALLRGHNTHGDKWSKIVDLDPIFNLNGRTDRAARDRWRRLILLHCTTEETLRNLVRNRNLRNPP